MRKILKGIYRERRRTVLVALLLFLAGAMALWHVDRSIFGLPGWLAGGLGFMLPLATILMAIAVAFPSFRSGTEVIAATIAFLALIGVFGPGPLAFGLPRPAFGTVWGVLLVTLVYEAYAKPWLDRLLPKRRLAFHSRSFSRLPPDRLWPALAQTPETAHLDPDEARVLIEWIEPGRTQRVIERVSDIATAEEIQHIEAAEPGRLFRFRYKAVNATPGAPATSGSYTYRLRPAGAGSEVLAERIIDRASWRARVFAWVDDTFGRNDDTRIARIERAAMGAAG